MKTSRLWFGSDEARLNLEAAGIRMRHMLLAYAKELGMKHERHVKLFKNGRSQAVRIPREFELPGENAVMRKEGTRLVIEPAPAPSLLSLLAGLQAIGEDFGSIDDPVPEPLDI